MPGWHAATKSLQEEGKLDMLGVIQEQNPDRARLFMQWQQMDWPILVDTFNVLEVSVVPLTYAIDEHGVVRLAGLRGNAAATIEEDFVNRTWPAPVVETTTSESNSPRPITVPFAGAALGDSGALETAIEHYRREVEQSPEDGWAHFRLAAAYRLRYDSSTPNASDFQAAIDHWQVALDLDPNNYIWRRRIQQYGPLLDKPYPFYDWIEKAQREVRQRGETPSALATQPTISEIARPDGASTASPAADEAPAHPDPRGRVFRDGAADGSDPLIHVEQVAVPRRIELGATTRVHLTFRPNAERLAHWNNETEPLRVWLELPPGWSSPGQLLEHPNPSAQATSTETRRLEFELEVPANRVESSVLPRAAALYYVCEDVDGTCLYRRQDINLQIDGLVASDEG